MQKYFDDDDVYLGKWSNGSSLLQKIVLPFRKLTLRCWTPCNVIVFSCCWRHATFLLKVPQQRFFYREIVKHSESTVTTGDMWKISLVKWKPEKLHIFNVRENISTSTKEVMCWWRCLVGAFVSNITQNVMIGFSWNVQDSLEMITLTID